MARFYIWFILFVSSLQSEKVRGFATIGSDAVGRRHQHATTTRRSTTSRTWRPALSLVDPTSSLSSIQEMSVGSEFPVVPLLVILALGIGFAAQTLINSQLEGEQGLGAFLKDGSGYQKSGFQPIRDGDRAVSQDDPLPWLKLPKLDFVDVAGQDQTVEDQVLVTLERLRLDLNQQLAQGNTVEASVLQNKMETLMKENGIDYQADD